MPKGVYKRKRRYTIKPLKQAKPVHDNNIVVAHMDTIDLILGLVRSIKKNKIGRLK